MTEQLHVKVLLDTSGIKGQLASAKNSMKNFGGVDVVGKESTQSAKLLQGAIGEIGTSLQSLRRFGFADFIGSIFGGSNNLLKQYMADITKLTEKIKFLKEGINFKAKTKNYLKDPENRDAFEQVLKEEYGDNTEGLQSFLHQLDKNLMNFDYKGEITKLRIEQMKKAVKAFGVALMRVLPVILAFAFALKKWVQTAVEVSKQIKEMAMNARKIGMTTDAYQKWGYVMQQVGGQAEDLIDFVKSLSSEQEKALQGNQDTIKTFKEIGISAEALSSMNQQELFEATVDGLSKVEDQVYRTALAYRIFGEEDASKIQNVLRMASGEGESLARTYELLGGVASQELVSGSIQLQGSILNLKTAFQGLRNVIAQSIIPVLISVINWITIAVSAVRMFFAVLFNIDVFGSIGAKASSATDKVNKFSGAVGGAGGAIQKLRRITMGFDELNIVNDPNKSGGGGGGGGGGIGALENDLFDEDSLFNFENLNRKLEDISKWFDTHKHQIEDITALVLTLGGLVGGIALLVTGHIPAGLALIGVGLLGIFIGMGDDGTWKRIGDRIIRFGKDVKDGLTKTWEEMKGIAEPIFDAIGDALIESLHLGYLMWSDFPAFMEQLGEDAKYVWDGATKAITNYFDWCMETIHNIFGPIGEWFEKQWDALVRGMKKLPGQFKKYFGDCWQYIKDIFKPWGQYFDELWEKIKGTFSGVGMTIGEAVKESATAIITPLVSWATRYINGWIDDINWAIDMINKIPGVNIGHAKKMQAPPPMLANGGIVDRGTLFVAGEAGKEAVVPLENNTQWIDKLAERINGKGNNNPTKVVLTVDGRELGYATINNINNITRQTGGLQLVL